MEINLFNGDPTAEIIELHNTIMDAVQTNLEKAVRIGELLTEQRKSLKHGEWLPWIEANLPFTDRSARRYIQLYENRGQVLESGGVVKALKMLTDSKPGTMSDLPDSIMKLGAILEDMNDGETVAGATHAEGITLVNIKLLPEEMILYELHYITEDSEGRIQGNKEPVPIWMLFSYLMKHPGIALDNITWMYPGCKMLYKQ